MSDVATRRAEENVSKQTKTDKERHWGERQRNTLTRQTSDSLATDGCRATTRLLRHAAKPSVDPQAASALKQLFRATNKGSPCKGGGRCKSGLVTTMSKNLEARIF